MPDPYEPPYPSYGDVIPYEDIGVQQNEEFVYDEQYGLALNYTSKDHERYCEIAFFNNSKKMKIYILTIYFSNDF